MIFSGGESDLFEFSSEANRLEWIETDKTRDHDCPLKGFDFCPTLKIIVTADTNGCIRIWNQDKIFLREIQFPETIDSLCFLNDRADILVSHA